MVIVFGERKVHRLFLGALFIAMLGSTATIALAMEQPIKEELTFEEAVEIAVRDNPGLAKMHARYQAMAEIPSQMGSLPDPMITLGAMNFPTDTFDRDQEPMTQVQLGFSQMFPFPGKLSLREEAAEFMAKSAFYSVAEMRLKLTNRVINQWWQVFFSDRAIDTIESTQILLRQFIEVARKKYETGAGLQQDVLLAQLELSKLIDKKIEIEALRRHQVIQLNVLMGREPQTAILLLATVDKSLGSILDEHRLYQLAIKARPLLKEKEQSLSAAESRLNLAEREYYPDFNVSVAYGERVGDNAMSVGGKRSDLLSMMIGVKFPLYATSKQSKAVKQRTSEYQKDRFDLEDEKLRVMAEISAGITDYQRSKEQLSLFEHGILPQAGQTVQSMLAGYQVSQVDFLNLVRSQITLFNYELQYWKALMEAKQSLSRLVAAVGEDAIYE